MVAPRMNIGLSVSGKRVHLILFWPYPVEVHCRRGDDDFGSDHDGRKTSRHGSVGPAVDGTVFRHAPPPDAADGRKSGSRLADDAQPRAAPVALCQAVETPREKLFFLCARLLPSGNFAEVAPSNSQRKVTRCGGRRHACLRRPSSPEQTAAINCYPDHE